MSIKLIEIGGRTFLRMYVQQRGVANKSIRRQKNILFPVSDNHEEVLKAAQKAERVWIAKLTQEVAFQENRGLPFGEIVRRWELDQTFNRVGKEIELGTIRDHAKRLDRFCRNWQTCAASELTRGDAREAIRRAIAEGASLSLQRKIKSSIETVFKWAIEEKLVSGIHHSPAYGLVLDDDEEEKVPPILSLEEVKKLLQAAKASGNPWYSVWAFALLTGMRSGELYALRWTAVDLETRTIRVFRSYSRPSKREKSTKSGYWRNVPISPQLFALIESELMPLTGKSEYVLPRVAGWEDGYAAEILRGFLTSIGIETRVVFHTLRACFATHLLAAGAEQTKVMKIGGWRDLKTFQIYVRLAGIDERGVTDNLLILPTDEAVAEKVGGMFNAAI